MEKLKLDPGLARAHYLDKDRVVELLAPTIGLLFGSSNAADFALPDAKAIADTVSVAVGLVIADRIIQTQWDLRAGDTLEGEWWSFPVRH